METHYNDRHMLWIIVGAVVIGLLIYAAGFYKGKESAWSEFVGSLHNESFGDKVSYILLADERDSASESEEESTEEEVVLTIDDQQGKKQ